MISTDVLFYFKDQIEATVQETWVGLKKMALVIAPEFGITI